MQRFRTLVAGLSFTECPRWHNGRLYVSDFYTQRVLAIDLTGRLETIAHVPGRPSGLGFLPDGRMLIASMLDRRIMRQEFDGRLEEHANLSAIAPWHVNDMLVDHEGRAWVGNFGFDLMNGAPAEPTSLICVDTDGRAAVVADGIGFPNGMAFTPAGTLIVAETFMNRLTAFDVHGATLSRRRTWASFGVSPTGLQVPHILREVDVAPDGICLDADGAVWVADAGKQRLLRVREGGQILEQIDTGGMGVFACMLGGDDRRTLFACVAPTFHEAEATAKHRAEIWTTRVETQGAGLP